MTLDKSPTAEDHFREWIASVAAPRDALLIEDSRSDADLILRQSRDFNIQWTVAYTGQQAIDLVRAKVEAGARYQLVVLDLVLPGGLDGPDLFCMLKAVCPVCPVLILSGNITNASIQDVTRHGFAMFALKPGAFSTSFFEQLFMALNIPRRSHKKQSNVEPGGACI